MKQLSRGYHYEYWLREIITGCGQKQRRVDGAIAPAFEARGKITPRPASTSYYHYQYMAKYLAVFAQAHQEFRVPELESIAQLYNIKLTLSDDPEECDPGRPYMILSLESEHHARLLAERCVLIK